MSHVFLSYVREDAGDVDRLRAELVSRGIRVWVDREQIMPGERWKTAIRQAIEDGAYFIACFSAAYANRGRTYMNEEVLTAIEQLRLRPVQRSWFIPVLFSDVSVPELSIGPSETLRDLQQVRLYDDWNRGIATLVEAIESRIPTTAAIVPGTPLVDKFVAMIDVVGYSSLVANQAEKLAEVLTAFAKTARQAAQIFRVDTVLTLSDTVLIVAETVPAGVHCTLDIMRRFAALAGQRSGFSMAVRAGASIGGVIHEENVVVGGAVVQAARIASNARPQQLLVTERVALQLLEESLMVHPLGLVTVRGFGEPVTLFDVKVSS